MEWLYVLVGAILTVLFVIIERNSISKHLKEWNRYRGIKKKFKPIDNSKRGKSPDTPMEAIDKFYNGKNEIDENSREKSLLLRKAHLQNNVNEPVLIKEVKVAVLSTVFGIFVSKIVDTWIESQTQVAPLGLYIALAIPFCIALIINVLCCCETEKQQIDEYEVSRIEEALGDHASK